MRELALKKQNEKIEKLKGELVDLQRDNDHTRLLIREEKVFLDERREQVDELLDILKDEIEHGKDMDGSRVENFQSFAFFFLESARKSIVLHFFRMSPT